MHVELTPRRLFAHPGELVEFHVTITNTTDVIIGCSLRPLGVDPSWVTIEDAEPRLFPAQHTVVRVQIHIPEGTPAGDRRVALGVHDLVDPSQLIVEDVVVEVAALPRLWVELEQPTQTAARKAQFAATVTNEGNARQYGRLAAVDPEGKLDFTVQPARLNLAPGTSTVVEIQAKAKRRWFGDPRLRPFELEVQEPVPAPSSPAMPVPGIFVQKALFSRALAGIFGLLLALSIFAVVVVVALGSVVQRSTADRDLALEVAQAKQEGNATGTGRIAGSVVDLSTGAAVNSVAVAVFSADDTASAIVTTSTNEAGRFAVSSLPAGSYLVEVTGAGYAASWYPAAAAAADAGPVSLTDGSAVTDLVVVVGGTPASLAGSVTGDDVGGTTLTVQLPLDVGILAGNGTAATAAPAAALGPVAQPNEVSPAIFDREPAAPAAPSAPAVPDGAVLATVPVASDGAFEVTGLPSPGIFDLVVTKPGYATTVQRIDVAAGEERKALDLPLTTGDGTITGTVEGKDGPLGGASVTASSGATTIDTVSLTQDDVGSFELQGLPTPGTYTVTVSAPGHADATLSLSLIEGQNLAGVAVVLGTDTAALSGRVTVPGGDASGVSVTVTDGALTLATVTQSRSPVGAWQVTGLRVPSTYTVTFSKDGLESQVSSVKIDSFGRVTSGARSASAVNATLRRATATLTGVVTQKNAANVVTKVGNANVTISSGTVQRVVSTQSSGSDRGRYRVSNLPAGTYTVTFSTSGTAPYSEIVQLTAGQTKTVSRQLVAPARIYGQAVGSGNAGLLVNLYLASEYSAEAEPIRQTTTDSAGDYSFDKVDAPEIYIVEIRTPGIGVGGTVRATSPALILSASQQRLVNLTLG